MEKILIDECVPAVLNSLQYIRESNEDAVYDIQDRFEELVGCKVIKKYRYDNYTHRNIPIFWDKLRFVDNGKYMTFLLRWK